MYSILLLRKSMGVAAARAVSVNTAEVVKPHVPLIKFPARGPGPVLKEIVNSATGKPVTSSTALNTEVNSKGPSRGSKGSAVAAIESSQLPQQYRRKPITKEEMEIIEKGGPV